MADTSFRGKLGNVRLKDNYARQLSMTDGLANIVSGMGGGTDQQSYAFYYAREIPRQQILASYKGSWVSRKVHNIPATDMVRAGWTHSADNVDITAIEAEERRLSIKNKLRKAELLSRLYGGSCLMMGVGSDDPSVPVNVNSVKKSGLRYLHALSRYQVNIDQLVLDPGSPYYGGAEFYNVSAGDGRYIRVHASRIIRFVNSDLDEEELLSQSGWGDPTLTALWSVIVNSDTAQSAFAALLAKAQVDTISVPGLTGSISTVDGEEAWKKRAVYTKMYESLFNVKLIDSGVDGNAEKWETFSVNWAGIPDVMKAFMQMVAGAADIPYTRFMGSSPDGMNATGISDEANYFANISAGQELNLRPRHEALNEILYRSALGDRPSEIWMDYNPLHIDSDEVKAKNAKLRAETSAIYSDTGLVPPEVMQESVKGQLIESGEYPGIEAAYADYASGTLEAIVEEPEEAPVDPLIPLDVNGNPTQNRESRLLAANDIAAALVGAGWNGMEAAAEANRLLDSRPNMED